MERIVQALCASKYSIHDLSRCQGEGSANLARFNMPLELGIAMAEGVGRRGSRYRHHWLLVVPHNHPYRQFISDLAGYDPIEYDGTPQGIVPAVMSWLATRPDAVQCSTPSDVLESLPEFDVAAKMLGDRWHGQAPWEDLVLEAIRVGRETGLIPATDT